MNPGDHDRDPGEQIIHDLGMDPGLDVDADQRAKLLQRWHQEAADKAASQKEAQENAEPDQRER
ncbi:MAG TPA: hypothetical protein VNF68_02310 [Candidatus Baltobacteraceae bacterium]|nr:hypothetical protein [Candidatus Baltobacteraceae bacterium]